MKEFRLPDPGEGLIEADIVTWRVAVGDQVAVNDIVVEIETSKSLVELPIPYAGTVARLLVGEGDTVDVGTPIIVIDDGSADAPEPAEPAGEERVANLVGYGPRAGSSRRRARRGDEASAAPAEGLARTFEAREVSRPTDVSVPLPEASDGPSGAPLPSPGAPAAEPGLATGTVLAKPPVRKLAKDLGVDLASVAPTGEGGVITRADVLATHEGRRKPMIDDQFAGHDEPAAAWPSPAMPDDQSTWTMAWAEQSTAEPRRVPIKGVRKQMAQAMVTSAFTAPHVTEWTTIDVTASMDFLERLKQRRDLRDIKLTPTVLVAKAVCLALRRHPDLQARWDGEAGEIVYPPQVNLGIAAATPRGLLVPNIKGADRCPLPDLAVLINEAVATARDGRTAPKDMSGGTFTITNIGVFDIDAGTPILNPGESGILAIGAIKRRPWVVGTGDQERIEPRWVTTLAVSFDHRVVDGETGSRFLAEVAGLLADPGLALLH